MIGPLPRPGALIDAHVHLWRLGQAGCTWPTVKDGAIHRDYIDADLDQLAEQHGIERFVLVQSQEADADTEWLLGQAATSERIAAVVGWVDFHAITAVSRIEALAAKSTLKSRLRGLRPMVQDRAPDWLLGPAVGKAVAAMAEAGLSLDALIRPVHLPALADLAQSHPGLAVVIDHAAKPAAGLSAEWRTGMERLAALPNVYCKLSGLLTETADPADAALTGRHILDLFGPERVMWGSDWPVVTLAAAYGDWLEQALALVDDSARDAVFGGTAARFYKVAV